ncbi:MAG: hypothetical protein LZF61_07330 [Nitrosomonas sp.]|nr:MAG: hypothetical protein LZF61_07330 [Nitrosomonas sp.]
MRRSVLSLLICLVVLFCAAEAIAQEFKNPRFRLSGFGTLDVTSAGTKQYGYHNEMVWTLPSLRGVGVSNTN